MITYPLSCYLQGPSSVTLYGHLGPWIIVAAKYPADPLMMEFNILCETGSPGIAFALGFFLTIIPVMVRCKALYLPVSLSEGL